MKKLGFIMLIVLVWAGVASAQSIEPYVYYSPATVKWPGGETASYSVIGLGVKAELGGGFSVNGSYAMGSGDLDLPFAPPLSIHTWNTLRLAALYGAYDAGGFVIGPMADYQTATWTAKDTSSPPGGFAQTFAGLGIGGFVAADMGGISLEASYVARPNSTVSGDGFSPEQGQGSTMAVGVEVPVSGALTLLVGYASDVLFQEGADVFTSSGARIGVTYAF